MLVPLSVHKWEHTHIHIHTHAHTHTHTHTHTPGEVQTKTVAVSNFDNVNCNAEFIAFTELYIWTEFLKKI